MIFSNGKGSNKMVIAIKKGRISNKNYLKGCRYEPSERYDFGMSGVNKIIKQFWRSKTIRRKKMSGRANIISWRSPKLIFTNVLVHLLRLIK